MTGRKHRVTMETVEDSGEPMIRDGSKPTFDLDILGESNQEAPSDEQQNLSWKEVAKLEEQARRERQNSETEERYNAKETAHIVEDYINHTHRSR
ncbi:hypothetical protein BDA99DRAFT_557403 [Phascolomyces articulosus]|uniref:Uncharacterized protein n=1 Tax=Phascolomyces articulosus TaxID=60185 RepID=A0AAD5KGR5_9FUNG|nr:hypothetical protein BDA99DRAFT_557403 [Phascolomyces articulosus]